MTRRGFLGTLIGLTVAPPIPDPKADRYVTVCHDPALDFKPQKTREVTGPRGEKVPVLH